MTDIIEPPLDNHSTLIVEEDVEHPSILEKNKTYAFTRAEDILSWSLHRVQIINDRLFLIEEQFKKLQPKKDGSVLLDLQNCNKHCLGCPHIRWVQWRWHSNKIQNKWLGHILPQGKHINYFRSTEDFAETYQTRIMFAKEVRLLEKERKYLIKHISNLSKLRASIIKHSQL